MLTNWGCMMDAFFTRLPRANVMDGLCHQLTLERHQWAVKVHAKTPHGYYRGNLWHVQSTGEVQSQQGACILISAVSDGRPVLDDSIKLFSVVLCRLIVRAIYVQWSQTQNFSSSSIIVTHDRTATRRVMQSAHAGRHVCTWRVIQVYKARHSCTWRAPVALVAPLAWFTVSQWYTCTSELWVVSI